MTTDIISIDRNIISNFIKENIEYDSFYGIENELLDAVLQIIPTLNHYEEEDQKLNFKLAIGMNTTIEDLNGRFHILQKHIYDVNDTAEIRTKKIINMIKKVAIFCSKDADVFIVQNQNIIECGVYFTDLEKTGSSEITLLNNNFVIFQGILKSRILAIGKNSSKLLCFDFESSENIDALVEYNFSDTLKATTCKTWKGIFEKVRKTVHGTICLIVNSEWIPENDDNFTSSINEININLSRDEKITADSFQDFDNKISLFLSMLNFDGITIIDTEENIRAYNVFCKIPDDCNNSSEGGARHRACNFLKNLPYENRTNYVAVYFQSQEGTIKFYKFNETSFDEFETFDPMIMNGGTNNPFYKQIKNHLANRPLTDPSQIEDFNDYLNYVWIVEHIDKLAEAHNGIDNFYNEPEPAKELFDLLSNSDYFSIVKKYPFIIKELANTVFLCIIGNSYGYSRAAQESLHSTLELFDSELWTYYFSKFQYIDSNLLWSLSNEKLFKRWKDTINSIFEKYPKLASFYDDTYTEDSFKYMYRALVNLENSDS